MGHTPTVVGDLLFIGSCPGIIHALDRRTGKVHWTTDVRPEGDTNNYSFHGDPLITENLVIIGEDVRASGVYALVRFTGNISWRYTAGGGIHSSVVGLGHNAYAATVDGQLICFDINSGHVRWSFPLDFAASEGPTVINKRVIAGGLDGNVYALDGDTGEVLWKKALDDPISTTVTVVESDLYLGTMTGRIYRLRVKDGMVVSTLQLDSMPRGKPLQAGKSLLVYLTDGKENYHSLASFDLSLKKERWRQKAPHNWSTTRLLVWEDCVVVGTSKGEVIAFNLSDGIKRWQWALEGFVRSIGSSGDTIYVGTKEGVIYALDPQGK